MKLERPNVEFALRRKKVDKSLFEHNGTTIPACAYRMRGLKQRHGNIRSRHDPQSVAIAPFKGNTCSARVTTAPHGHTSPAFRLWYEPALSTELKNVFYGSLTSGREDRVASSTGTYKGACNYGVAADGCVILGIYVVGAVPTVAWHRFLVLRDRLQMLSPDLWRFKP